MTLVLVWARRSDSKSISKSCMAGIIGVIGGLAGLAATIFRSLAPLAPFIGAILAGIGGGDRWITL